MNHQNVGQAVLMMKNIKPNEKSHYNWNSIMCYCFEMQTPLFHALTRYIKDKMLLLMLSLR